LQFWLGSGRIDVLHPVCRQGQRPRRKQAPGLLVAVEPPPQTRPAPVFGCRHQVGAQGIAFDVATDRIIEAASLSSHSQFKSEAQKTTYLADYSRMGAKGLFSLDCVIGPKRPSNYFMVVTPSCPLKVNDLPNEIRQILNMTRYEGKFCSVEMIKENEVA
jgi:hypothetical protein